jgi:site-specific recombinase XerD
MSPTNSLKLLNKLSVTRLAELSKLSKAYISQVKNGKRPPSQTLLASLSQVQKRGTALETDYLNLFLQSRRANEVSEGSYTYYKNKLSRFAREIKLDKAQQSDVEKFLLQFNNVGNRHAYYRVIKTFFNWREQNFNLPNPVEYMKAPRLGKLIMPSLTQEQVLNLIGREGHIRNKAILALFTESGLRLSELTDIEVNDIDWDRHTIRVIGKGKKEAYAPFGSLSEKYLKLWLGQYTPVNNIWGLNQWGIISFLRRLEIETGLPCNPHTFRRTFACLLRKAGVDTMTIKDLGRWESLEMVQRYTRSITFQDSLKFYKAPLS